MANDHPPRIRFAEFELDAAEGLLRKNGDIVKLPPQPLKALALLASRPGELVTREQLRAAIWGDEVVVDFEHGLNTCIRQIRSALGEDAEQARIIETVPKLGYRFKAPVSPVSTVPRPWWVRHAAVGAGIIAVILATYFLWTMRRDSGAGPDAGVELTSMPRPRPAVAVLGFRNLTQRPDAAWLSHGLADMLATELAADGALRVVSGEAVDRGVRELPARTTDDFSAEDLQRMRQSLAADLIVFGSYTLIGPGGTQKIRVDVRIHDAIKAAMLPPVSESGSETDVFDLVWRIGTALRKRLGVQPLSAEQVVRLRASLPTDARGARAYTQGLASLRGGDAETARKLLEQAVQIQPDYAPVRSALSSAWRRLGDQSKARAEGQRAFELSGNLPREEQLLIEARYRQVLNESDRLLAICRTLFEFYPDNLEYGLMLLGAYSNLNKRQEALDTIDTLRRLRASAADDVELDLAEAHTARLTSDLKRALAAATRAAEKATAMGSRDRLASARMEQALAFQALGQPAEAIASMEQAAEIYEATGNRQRVAGARMSMARLSARTGDVDRARKMYESAAATFRAIGSDDGARVALMNLGAMLSKRGNLTGGQAVYERVLREARASPDRRGVLEPLCSVAELLLRQGELNAARVRFEEVATISRTSDRNYNLGPRALRGIAAIAVLQGNVQTAKTMNERALAISREGAHPTDLGLSLSSLAMALLAQGDLGGARRVIEEAEAIPIRPSLPIDQLVGGAVDLARATLAIEEGRSKEAAATAQRAAERFRNADEPEDEAYAYEALAHAWLASRSRDEAQRAIDRAADMSKASQNRLLRASVGTTAARVAAMPGDASATADAIRQLERIIGDAANHGLVALELEARLALGEIEIASGRQSARARLEALQRAATSYGLMRIAGKAARAVAAVASR